MGVAAEKKKEEGYDVMLEKPPPFPPNLLLLFYIFLTVTQKPSFLPSLHYYLLLATYHIVNSK